MLGRSLANRSGWRWPAIRSGVVAVFPWMLLGILVVASVSLFVRFFFFTDMFSVQQITIIDAKPQTEAAVQTAAEQAIARLPWRNNIFFLQADLLAAKLASELPQVKSVLVKRILPSTVKISVQEKQPAMLLLSRGSYYFVDDQGILFQKADLLNLPGLVLPTVKNLSEETEATIGLPAVSSQFVNFVKISSNNISEALEAEVVEIQMPSLAAREVYFMLSNNWEVKFDITRDPKAQIDLLQRVVDEMLSESEKQTLEYIDLRIPRRVYYKTAT